MEYINLYKNNPQENLQDGTQISTDRALTQPLTAVLNASEGETVAIKCAVRCENGFETVGDTTVSAYFYNEDTQQYEATGGNIDKFSFCLDNDYIDSDDALLNGTFTKTLTISDVIQNYNKCFWVKVASDKSEKVSKDTTVSINLKATVTIAE